MVIVCTSTIAAVEVIALLFRQNLWPTFDFHVRQKSEGDITIIIARTLSAEQVAQLRDAIATTAGASIQ